MSTFLRPAECPSGYPSETAERRVYLTMRGWHRLKPHHPEAWRNAAYPGLTFALSNACRVEAHIGAPENEAQ